jgi:hypothetical protein
LFVGQLAIHARAPQVSMRQFHQSASVPVELQDDLAQRTPSTNFRLSD